MSTQQAIALQQPPIVLFKKPVWDNPTSRRNKPFWTCETIFGTVSIHQKSDGIWRLHGDFISRIPDDDEEYKGFGINTIDQSRVYDDQDPEVLKTVIDNLHLKQLEKFLDLIAKVEVPADGQESVKKESTLVKFNCNLTYSSKDCDYNTSFHTGKNSPDQVLIDVIKHLGWMAALDGDGKRAIAALYQGIERGGARAIELASIKTPKTEVHSDDLAKDQQIARMQADIDIADKKYRIAGESEFYDSPEELLARNDLEPIGKTEIQCFAMLEQPSLYAYVKQDGEGNWENVLIDDEDDEDA